MCEVVKWLIFAMLGMAGVIDAKKREIPLWLLIAMSVAVGGYTLCSWNTGMGYRLAGVGLGFFFFGVSKVTREAVGYGDSWVILLLGIQLGIMQTLQILFMASILAAVFAVFYLWRQNWDRNITLPFLPFLAISYIGVIVT